MAATDSSALATFFTEYGEAQRYTIKEVIGKGSYGVVCSAIDTTTGVGAAKGGNVAAAVPEAPTPLCHARPGDKVAIKKINDVFEHVSVRVRPVLRWGGVVGQLPGAGGVC